MEKLKALVKLDDLKKSKDRSNDYPFSDEEKNYNVRDSVRNPRLSMRGDHYNPPGRQRDPGDIIRYN